MIVRFFVGTAAALYSLRAVGVIGWTILIMLAGTLLLILLTVWPIILILAGVAVTIRLLRWARRFP